ARSWRSHSRRDRRRRAPRAPAPRPGSARLRTGRAPWRTVSGPSKGISARRTPILVDCSGRATLRAMRTAIGDTPRAVLWLTLGASAGIGCAAVGLRLSGGRDRARPAKAAASVNGSLIRLEEYDRAVAAFASDRREPIGPAERRHVLDRMLDEELLVQRGVELGLARTDP